MFAVVVVITGDLPASNKAVPWNTGFDATALNYTPAVLILGLLVAIWWQVSAKNKYTGPVRTIDTDELGHVIEPEPPSRPEPPPAGAAPTPAS